VVGRSFAARALVLAGCLCGAAAWAQPVRDQTRASSLMRSLEVTATAIRTTSLPIEAVQREASQMEVEVEQLPFVLDVASGDAAAIQVDLRTHVAHLVIDANAPDRFASASDAYELLGDLGRLRDLSGLPR
jgi:hypothetical protein